MNFKEEIEIKEEFEIQEEIEIKDEFEIQEEIEIKEEFDPFQLLNDMELTIKKENAEEASVPGSSTVFLDIEKQRMSSDNFQIKCEPEMPSFSEDQEISSNDQEISSNDQEISSNDREISSNDQERRSQQDTQEHKNFNHRHKKRRKVKMIGGLSFSS
jgi:hypothetical protein